MEDWMTANQVVAANLRRARITAGLTQEQVAERLEEYLGVRWSPAVFSHAERSASPGARRRQFDANDLLALSQVFELAVGWFFIEPEDGANWISCNDQGKGTRIAREGLGKAVGPPVRLADLRSEVKGLQASVDKLERRAASMEDRAPTRSAQKRRST